MFWMLPIYVIPSERASERRDGSDEIPRDADVDPKYAPARSGLLVGFEMLRNARF